MKKKDILIVGLITLAALGIIEIACRTFGAGSLADSDFRFYIRQVDNDLRLDYIVEDPLLMWSLKPGYKDRQVSISSQGFRDIEYQKEKPAGVFRILCLGDSCTFGYQIPLEATYHSLLEDRLNKERASPEKRYEVINAGVVGYSTIQGLAMYLYKGSEFKPDLVTVYFGSNDTRAHFYLSDARIMHIGRPEWLNIFVNKWLLKLDMVRLLRKEVADVMGRKPFAERQPTVRVSVAEYRDAIMQLQQACDQNGAELLFISPPLRMGQGPTKGWARDMVAYRHILEHTAETCGIPVLTIPEMTESAVTDSSILFLKHDSVHPSQAGHRLIMESLYGFIIKNGMLK